MKDWNEADRRLVDWLKDRTDVELQRLLDAPDDGLTNRRYYLEQGCACMAGWAFDLGSHRDALDTLHGDNARPMIVATDILTTYGLSTRLLMDDDGTVFRHIKAFVAAELFTRRVDRKALPAPREAAHA